VRPALVADGGALNMIARIKQYSPIKRALLLCFFITLLALIVTGTILVIYVFRVTYIKANGIQLKPSRDFDVKSIQYYLQNDSEWSGDNIGKSSRQMGGAGCLVTCVASAITDLGVHVTPKDVNLRLTEIDGFQGAELVWYKINEAFSEIDYKYTRVFSSKIIEDDLKAGLLPIVNVNIRGSGATHWLLIIGAKNGEFLAFDPLNSSKEPIALSTHGNVYSYRVLVHTNVE